VNTEGDNTLGGFVVVEKHTNEYKENSFGPFISSPKTPKGSFLSN